jgi:hypothetical protein
MFGAPRNLGTQRKSETRSRFARRPLTIEQLEERCLLTFLPAVNYPVGSYPQGITVADFRGNGILDVAVADYAVFGGTGGVSVLLGNGDGSFQPAQTYPWPKGIETTQVRAVDFNDDGIPDLVESNYVGSSLSVMLGNGDGTFGPMQNFAFATSPGDFQVIGSTFGRPDFAITNAAPDRIQVLRGFTSTYYNTGSTPISIQTADLRGNGMLDLVVANRQSNTVSVLLGNADGTFQAARNYVTGLHPDTVIVGDFTGNGVPDLATANFDGNSVSVFLGNGDGTFRPAMSFPAGSNPISVAAADFNGDGSLDLAVTSGTTSNVAVLLGNGNGTFRPPLLFTADHDGDTVVAANLKGRGRPDLVVSNYGSNDVSILLNDGLWPAPVRAIVIGAIPVQQLSPDPLALPDPAPAAVPPLAAHPSEGLVAFSAPSANTINVSATAPAASPPPSSADVWSDDFNSLGFAVFSAGFPWPSL